MSRNAYEFSIYYGEKNTCSAKDHKNWKWHNMTLSPSTTDPVTGCMWISLHLTWHAFKNRSHFGAHGICWGSLQPPNPKPPVRMLPHVCKRQLCPNVAITFRLNDYLCSSSCWCSSSVCVLQMVEFWLLKSVAAAQMLVTLQCALSSPPWGT